MSQGVLLRTLRMLGNGGVLEVFQGRGSVCGGFSLRRGIDEITMLDVISIMQPIDMCKNLDEEYKNEDSPLFSACSQIGDHLKAEFDGYTIRDLFERK